MSHFSVIVVGPDIKIQLQPFHEFECTGTDDQYVIEIDETQKYREMWEKGEKETSFLAWVQEYTGRPVLRSGGRKTKNHKYGYICLDGEDNVTVINRTNPNAKWDYWKIGGRWNEFFPLRNGLKANQATIGEIDFDQARLEMEVCARKDFALWESSFNRFKGGDRTLPWKSFIEKTQTVQSYTMDQARVDYNAQPAIQEYNKHGFYWGCPVEDFGFDREIYIKKMRASALITYAIVHDGHWLSCGDMGWWGMSSNETDDWEQKASELLDSLPPDTLVTIVDCHI